eukprot:gene23927-30211_t
MNIIRHLTRRALGLAALSMALLSPGLQALSRLEKAMMKMARNPAMKEKMVKLGYESIGSSSAELAAAQKTDLDRWEKPIKATGVQLD